MRINRRSVLKPDFVAAHYNLGFAYRKLGSYQEAVEALKEAIRLKPDYVNARYNLGVSYFLLGDTSSALQEHKNLRETE
jgi:tetratricopeptide (TPR) repeat protein